MFSEIWYLFLNLPMSFSTNLEDTPLAMKGLFRSRPRMSKLGSQDEEAGVDDPVVLEDGP